MVAPKSPSPNGQPTTFGDLVNQTLSQVAAVNQPKHTQPKDDPAFIERYSKTARQVQQEAVIANNCPCPSCKLALYELTIEQFACTETVKAAFTGDTSKLQAVCDLIAKMKAAG
jgi:hypothetical protein